MARKIAVKPVVPVQTEEQKFDKFWAKIKEQAVARGETDCPICFMPLNYKKTLLLSCSHVYHQSCLANFEKFEKEADIAKYDGVGSDGFKCSCPMCRTQGYTKIDFQI